MLRSALSVLVVLLLPGLSCAIDANLTDVITALETPFKQSTQPDAQIRDFQAEFVQKSHIASINRVQRGEGTVRFKFLFADRSQSPVAQFRWDYRLPSIQEIISDGRKMWVYLPENRQVIESDILQLDDHQGENPVTFLTGLGNLSRDFNVSWSPDRIDKDGNYQLTLQPRKESQLIQQMKIVVNKEAVSDWRDKGKTGKRFPILATFVTDAQGNQTAIEFLDARVNESLSPDLFIFEIPADVERIKPEQMTF